MAFAGLIITLILQKKEQGLQRDELEQTRKELKNQRLEFETQNKTLKQQQFESALYNMLQLQQQIVNDFAYDTAVEGYSDTTARNGWTGVREAGDRVRRPETGAGTGTGRAEFDRSEEDGEPDPDAPGHRRHVDRSAVRVAVCARLGAHHFAGAYV